MKIACYTDIHNQQVMLNYPTTLRKSAVVAAEKTLEDMCRDSWRWQKNNPNGYRDA